MINGIIKKHQNFFFSIYEFHNLKKIQVHERHDELSSLTLLLILAISLYTSFVSSIKDFSTCF